MAAEYEIPFTSFRNGRTAFFQAPFQRGVVDEFLKLESGDSGYILPTVVQAKFADVAADGYGGYADCSRKLYRVETKVESMDKGTWSKTTVLEKTLDSDLVGWQTETTVTEEGVRKYSGRGTETSSESVTETVKTETITWEKHYDPDEYDYPHNDGVVNSPISQTTEWTVSEEVTLVYMETYLSAFLGKPASGSFRAFSGGDVRSVDEQDKSLVRRGMFDCDFSGLVMKRVFDGIEEEMAIVVSKAVVETADRGLVASSTGRAKSVAVVDGQKTLSEPLDKSVGLVRGEVASASVTDDEYGWEMERWEYESSGVRTYEIRGGSQAVEEIGKALKLGVRLLNLGSEKVKVRVRVSEWEDPADRPPPIEGSEPIPELDFGEDFWLTADVGGDSEAAKKEFDFTLDEMGYLRGYIVVLEVRREVDGAYILMDDDAEYEVEHRAIVETVLGFEGNAVETTDKTWTWQGGEPVDGCGAAVSGTAVNAVIGEVTATGYGHGGQAMKRNVGVFSYGGKSYDMSDMAYLGSGIGGMLSVGDPPLKGEAIENLGLEVGVPLRGTQELMEGEAAAEDASKGRWIKFSRFPSFVFSGGGGRFG